MKIEFSFFLLALTAHLTTTGFTTSERSFRSQGSSIKAVLYLSRLSKETINIVEKTVKKEENFDMTEISIEEPYPSATETNRGWTGRACKIKANKIDREFEAQCQDRYLEHNQLKIEARSSQTTSRSWQSPGW